MATRPTETLETVSKPNGCMKTIKKFSYVVTLCRKGSDEVKAVRMDGYTSKYDPDFRADLAGNWPESKWFVKSILKLYDTDFEGGTV